MTRRLGAPLFVACVAACLVAGVLGGLLRAGVVAPALASAEWLARSALAHAALMMCGFFGTVIGIERAVASKRFAAWAAPFLSAAGGIALIAGVDSVAAGLLVAAGSAFVAVNVALWRRQPAAHVALLVGGGGAWWIGILLWAGGAASGAVLPWWFAFLVLTIGAERLEMTRLMRRRPAAQASLWFVLAALVAGAALSALDARAGGVVFGAALFALAAWLLAFDIARRTVRVSGLPRYMAVCLLSGYVWLAIGGVSWAATSLGWPARDAALHAVGLGFVFSMVMGHAPVILPAVARVKLVFGWFFYVPLVFLHVSLAARLAGPLVGRTSLPHGAGANALALLLFAFTVIGAALLWRRKTIGHR